MDNDQIVFDLSKISLDEALAILEFEPGNSDPGYMARFVRTIRKCLVSTGRELTGADVIRVIQTFTAAIMGADDAGKN